MTTDATASPTCRLGTVLSVWAHPDDETYLVGGLSAAADRRRAPRRLRDRDPRGGGGPGRRTRRAGRPGRAADASELEAALAILGVTEHHWLDLPGRWLRGRRPRGGGRAAGRAARRRAARHGGHVRSGRLHRPPRPPGGERVDRPARSPGQPRRALLHAVAREQAVDPELDEDFGVFELGRPRMCADDELAVLLRADGSGAGPQGRGAAAAGVADRGLVAAVGLERFRAWVATESFAPPRRDAAPRLGHSAHDVPEPGAPDERRPDLPRPVRGRARPAGAAGGRRAVERAGRYVVARCWRCSPSRASRGVGAERLVDCAVARGPAGERRPGALQPRLPAARPPRPARRPAGAARRRLPPALEPDELDADAARRLAAGRPGRSPTSPR